MVEALVIMESLSTQPVIRTALVAPALAIGLLLLWIGTFHVHNPLVLVPVGLLLLVIPVSFLLELFAVRAAVRGGNDGVFPRTLVNVAFLSCGVLVIVFCGVAMMWFIFR